MIHLTIVYCPAVCRLNTVKSPHKLFIVFMPLKNEESLLYSSKTLNSSKPNIINIFTAIAIIK